MTYNVNERKGSNHYNCPVVAYYPLVIKANVSRLCETKYINDYIGIHNKKEFVPHFKAIMKKYGYDLNTKDLKTAAASAYAEYDKYLESIRSKADEFIGIAKATDTPVIVLCGRPYHIDPEINHGISTLICDLGAIVITEDAISHKIEKFRTSVLNQWTYHSRLYCAAKYVAKNTDKNLNMNLVQLVSFGCGVDAVTGDEVRAILENDGKLYTQLKIDEISNLGAVKIRLRSLFAVMDDKTK